MLFIYLFAKEQVIIDTYIYLTHSEPLHAMFIKELLLTKGYAFSTKNRNDRLYWAYYINKLFLIWKLAFPKYARRFILWDNRLWLIAKKDKGTILQLVIENIAK